VSEESVRLIDLNPAWVDAAKGPGVTNGTQPQNVRRGIGLQFDCPCGCGLRAGVEFTVAVDGLPWRHTMWERKGDTFETLTVRPSIGIDKLDGRGFHYHGWLRDGVFVPA
jgi:hypothetical protein